MALSLKNILFLDIETASALPSLEDLNPRMKELWLKKAKFFKSDLSLEELYFDKAAIYAEFGKVLCVGIGGMFETQKTQKFKAKVICEDSEKATLEAFVNVLNEHPAGNDLILCAHNGKEFDFPYLSRRMLVNGIKLPYILDNSTKKPWEVMHLDTLEFWKFGDYKNYTSLDLLAAIFDVPSSKINMDGSEVNATYYIEKNVEKIKEYCCEDVVVLAQLYLKLNALELIPEQNIIRG